MVIGSYSLFMTRATIRGGVDFGILLTLIAQRSWRPSRCPIRKPRLSIASVLMQRMWNSDDDAPSLHHQLAARGSVRKFRSDTIPYPTLQRLCALALCAPTKSDLQQRDIIIVDAPSLKSQIGALLTDGPLGQKWIADVPSLLLFCGNNRRQRRIHALRDRPFVNDHLDAFFNAAVDAGIALSAFVIAAEAEGLGVCPISAIRNHCRRGVAASETSRSCFPGRRPRRGISGRGAENQHAASAVGDRASQRISRKTASTMPSRPMTGAARPPNPMRLSAVSRSSDWPKPMAGRRTRRGNMRAPNARISAPM